MGLFSKDVHSMADLYRHTLQDIYYAEKQIIKAFPKMIHTARSAELKDGLSDHMAETHTHVKRLEDAFHMLGQEPKTIDCPAIDGILREATEIFGEIGEDAVFDAAVAAAAQAVEHYEITRYGTLIAWSEELGHGEIGTLLLQSLEEEYPVDDALSAMATLRLNRISRNGARALARSATARVRP